tara:strand:+ start:960 stop:2219 length:1260 start_codon:yes stop_codon:yes gene_type:complete
MDINTLRNALMGLKGETPEAPEVQEAIEVPYDTEANQRAAIEQSNAAVENPNTQTKPERIEAVQKQVSLETPQGQLDQAREIASVPSNPSAETNIRNAVDKKDDKTPQQSAEMMKYKEIIDKMEALQNAPKKEASTDDTVMNWLTGIGQGAKVYADINNVRTPNVEYWGDKTAKKEASAKKEELGGLKQLQDAYGKYMALQNKDKKDDMTKYQKKSLEIQSKRLGLMDTKEGRLTKKDAFREKVGNRLSDAEIKKITEIDDGTRMLDEIDELFKSDDVKKHLGPIDSKLAYMQKFTSEQPQGYVKMHQAVGLNLASYIKSISGAAVSEPEAIRLGELVPTVSDNPGEFKAKLDFFRKELKQSKQDYLRNIGQQKTGAEKFKSEPKQTSEIDTRIQKVMDANPGSTYEQVKKALKAKGKL